MNVQQAVEQSVLEVAKQLESQIDNEMYKLENLQDDDIETLRQRRMQQLKHQQEKQREWIAKGHGEYRQILNEKEFFSEMKGEEKMICHFYRESMPCKIMDKHLATLTKKHLETKFVKILAEKSPFLTEKLGIWMLPTLALIQHQKVVDYVVGFDDLGGKEDFPIDALEARLARAGVINYDETAALMARVNKSKQSSGVRKGGFQATASDEDSDFDE